MIRISARVHHPESLRNCMGVQRETASCGFLILTLELSDACMAISGHLETVTLLSSSATVIANVITEQKNLLMKMNTA